MGDVLVRHQPVELELVCGVTGQLEATFAHELHGPFVVVATAIGHPRQVAQQGLHLALRFQQGSLGGLPLPAGFDAVEREADLAGHAFQQPHQLVVEETDFVAVVHDGPDHPLAQTQREHGHATQAILSRGVAPRRHARVGVEVIDDIGSAVPHGECDRAPAFGPALVGRDEHLPRIRLARSERGHRHDPLLRRVHHSDPGRLQAAEDHGDTAGLLQQRVALLKPGHGVAGDGQRRVQIGQPLDLALRLLALRDVAHENLHREMLAVTDGRGGDLDLYGRTVEAQKALLLGRYREPLPHALDAPQFLLTIVRVHDVQRRHADDLAGPGGPQQFHRRAVGVLAATVGVHQDRVR